MVMIGMLNDPDPEKLERVMKAKFQIEKCDTRTLKHGYDAESYCSA